MASRLTSRRWFLRDLSRNYRLLGMAALGIAILTYFIDWTPVRHETSVKPDLNIAPNAKNEQQFTGSIIFPIRGNLCRQIILDNRTWNMSEKGYVKCDEAISELEEKNKVESGDVKRLQSVSRAFNKTQ